MARYTGPKDRLSRREGFDIFGKGSKLTRINVPPGMHGTRMTRQPSQYGRQLREKQKVKRIYGIYERQFSNYIKKALKTRENTGQVLLSLLESRLDNVVYRLGFSTTRPGARQLVSHRHVKINDNWVNIPSYQVRVGETLSLSADAGKIASVAKALENKSYKVPSWLERKGLVGRVKKAPSADDVIESISIQDIIEFYSR